MLSLILFCLLLRLLANADPSYTDGLRRSTSTKAVYGTIPKPSAYQSPRLRWWWPGGWIDVDEVSREITDIANAGFGGGEIGDVEDSIINGNISMPPEVYGWAQPRWNSGLLSAYTIANKLGVHVDMTMGPHWPTGVPGFTPDSLETSKELVHGQVFVTNGSFSGPLPLPVARPSGITQGNPNVTATPNLVAVLAAVTTRTNQSASVIDFDQSSLLDLTADVVDGHLNWTTPSSTTYVLVAVYGRGTGQIQRIYDGTPSAPKVTSPFPAYIVDHLSPEGVQVSADYWNAHILSDGLRAELKKSKGSLFEDSLELLLKQYWTTNFTAEFTSRRGYDIIPYLLYVLKDTNTFVGDTELASAITHDFYSTVTDLYIEYRLAGLTTFAHNLGLKLRAQPYTANFDSCKAASVLDIPEGESLGFSGRNDAFRILAAGRDTGGKARILSNELGAFANDAYRVTWRFLLGTANLDFALGVNQVVIHGYPYRDAADSQWPGFAAFTPLRGNTPGFADAWGVRQPQWTFAQNASTYLAHSQALLQAGEPSVDVAILNLELGVTATWADPGLNAAGYSYQFPSSAMFLSGPTVFAQSRLFPQGPAYKALVINNETSLNTDAALVIQSFAHAGLPVVLVGRTPNSIQSFSTNLTAENARISSIFADITALQTTATVTTEADVPAALASLGVVPSVQYSQGASILTHRRRNLEGSEQPNSLYWVYNNEPNTTITQTISFEGEGSPVNIDCWTGKVTSIAIYTNSGGRTNVTVSLKPGVTKVIYIGQSNPWGAKVLSDRHVTESSAAVSAVGDSLVLHATKGGTYNGRLSTGDTFCISIDSLPAPVIPSSWNLTVEDWSPKFVNETGLNSSLTTKTMLKTVQLNELTPWPNISEIGQFASGIGSYAATINLDLSSPSGDSLGVNVDIGFVEGTWGLTVNGRNVAGVDFFINEPLDITDYVVRGTNHILITVATTLNNKLRSTFPVAFGANAVQPVGLTGPVTFTYFASATL